jgi:hypothetical protein
MPNFNRATRGLELFLILERMESGLPVKTDLEKLIEKTGRIAFISGLLYGVMIGLIFAVFLYETIQF